MESDGAGETARLSHMWATIPERRLRRILRHAMAAPEVY